MNVRRVIPVLASVALSAILIALLVRVGKIDVRLTLLQLQAVSVTAFLKLVLLNCLLIYLSTEKWRSVDAAIRRSSDSVPSRPKAFAITSAGMALGLVLPVQLGMSVARTLGTYVHGRALKRGMAGTLLEQSFDVLIVAVLAVASAITWSCGGGGAMWTASAVAMTAVVLLLVGPAIRLLRWLASYTATKAAPQSRMESVTRRFSELQLSAVLNTRLARRLVLLSGMRFAVVVLMAGQTAQAVGAHIPLWHFAAAMPFVVMATVIAVTPGGLGVNELTSATALKLFGTPLTVAVQWALTNRILVVASCFVVAGLALIMLVLERMVLASMHGARAKKAAEGDVGSC